MQTAVLPARACSLVPHSTRPVWHEWQQQHENNRTTAAVHSARRRLFAEEEPAAEEQNQQFVQRLLAELAERYSQKWNFDFEKGRPMECGEQQQQQQYEYEAMPADNVPGFYRMRHPPQQTAFSAAAASCQQQQQQFAGAINDENQWSKNNKNGKNVGMEADEEDGHELAQQSTAATDDEQAIVCWKSPSRVLRKASRRVSAHQTPKRNSAGGGGVNATDDEQQQQCKLTDFLSVRKSLSRSCTKENRGKEDCCASNAYENSPSKRRRHSLVGTVAVEVPSARKTIARRSQRVQQQQQQQQLHHHVRLFH